MNALFYHAIATAALFAALHERFVIESRLIRLHRVDRLLDDGRGREARRVTASLQAEYAARRSKMPGWYA